MIRSQKFTKRISSIYEYASWIVGCYKNKKKERVSNNQVGKLIQLFFPVGKGG
jgi:hypothetical protein